jgi:endonuclease-3 related protein
VAGPHAIYGRLRKHFGFLNWWPGETTFEIFVGAILTQQTSWKNVEKAIANIKKENCMNIDCIASISINKLEEMIRPAGYYRQKAKRLKNICISIKDEYGSLEAMFRLGTTELRNKLLSYNGIGNETADSIVLYAAEKPVFVIDAYTKRIMHRLGITPENISYNELQKYFEKRVPKNIKIYKDFHAQFVELGKNYCKKKPACNECPLNSLCSYAKAMRKNAR